jgi:hypothetical protein
MTAAPTGDDAGRTTWGGAEIKVAASIVERRSGNLTPHVRAELCERLATNRAELEDAALTRVCSIADPAEVDDPDYAEGLRHTVSAAVSYALAALASGAEAAPPVPPALLEQARHAARCQVSLNTVLRRYLAGYVLFSDFLVAESGFGKLLSSGSLKVVLRELAVFLDRLLTEVGEAYNKETEARRAPITERKSRLILRLLAGELVTPAELGYELDQVHLGVIATGPNAMNSVRGLAAELDRRLLSLRRDDGAIWGWLGGRRSFEPEQIERILERGAANGERLALGEPASGLSGWRLSHRQARAAFSLVWRTERSIVRYAEVALLASIVQDDLLTTSLQRLYLDPLSRERDRGAALRATLRAYFEAQRNVSSTAAALGVSRKTVNSRLRTVEQRIGRPLHSCAAELEAALLMTDTEVML